jgi:DNA-binding NtrC family response regulator
MKKKMVLLIDEKKDAFEGVQLALPNEIFLWDQTSEKGFNTLNLLKDLISLVILDYRVCGEILDTKCGGVLGRLKSAFPKIPVVVLGQGAYLEGKVIGQGALTLLEKPINVAYLENIIESLK